VRLADKRAADRAAHKARNDKARAQEVTALNDNDKIAEVSDGVVVTADP